MSQISQIIGIHSNKIHFNPFNLWRKKQTKDLFNVPKPIQKKAILIPSEILIFALLKNKFNVITTHSYSIYSKSDSKFI